jgi:hypothetical protein
VAQDSFVARFQAQPSSVPLARRAVVAYTTAHGVADPRGVEIAVSEAVTNAVIHGYVDRTVGTIEVTAGRLSRANGLRGEVSQPERPARPGAPHATARRRHSALGTWPVLQPDIEDRTRRGDAASLRARPAASASWYGPQTVASCSQESLTECGRCSHARRMTTGRPGTPRPTPPKSPAPPCALRPGARRRLSAPSRQFRVTVAPVPAGATVVGPRLPPQSPKASRLTPARGNRITASRNTARPSGVDGVLRRASHGWRCGYVRAAASR